MNADSHAKAVKLIAQERVEGISPADHASLESHLHACAFCAAVARDTEEALRALTAVDVPFPSGLAARTQFRVRLRAQELQESEPQRRTLWAIAAVSWAMGVATAPYVWRAFEWLGERTGIPKFLWESGVVLWWTIPALIATGILLLENAGRANERAWSDR
ncbi:MAG TPA: hypothetical protein VOA64_04520 [Candidatus Dormibacteraeota bacterium]|nr:hypothetical protein [Candidatus Dormibacteraeota bacterium]